MKNNGLQETAILIFANSAQVDARKKSTVQNVALFQELTTQTLKVVKQSGLPFFHISEKEQQGTSFGERFSNAIQTVYDLGFENVITIGNDSPQLKTSHILEANKQLKLGKTVLGPSMDGGFYLMGLHRSNFDAQLFLRLPWQRFGLFHKISQLFESYNSSIFKLQRLHDIDVEADIHTLLNFSKRIKRIPTTIFKMLINLINKTHLFFESTVQKPIRLLISLPYNKGSPCLSFS